jgi:hypothetical protein
MTLLLAYAMSLPPDYLFKGLPAYGKRYVDGTGWQINPLLEVNGAKNNFLTDECPRTEDNPILRFSTSIAEARDVWALLADEFIKKLDNSDLDGDEELYAAKTSTRDLKTTPKRTRRSNRLMTLLTKEESEIEEGTPYTGREKTPPSQFTVAPQAWSLLDWIVLCLEKDATLREYVNRLRIHTNSVQDGGYSPILLSQIPIDSPRSDISTPLQVAFSALSIAGPNEFRFQTGMRLLTQVR